MPTQRDLYKLIAANFSLEELKELTFDLGIAYEDIPGSNRRSKARELQTYMTRRGRLNELMAAIHGARDFLDLTPYGYVAGDRSEETVDGLEGAVPGAIPDWPPMDKTPAIPGSLTYENFDLRIVGPFDDSYLVEVLYSPYGQVMPVRQQFPLDDYEFADLVGYLQDLVGRAEDAVELGKKMRGLLFPGDIWSKFLQSRTAMKAADKGLRVRLRIDPPELGNLPWEYCYDSTFDFLAHDKLTPVVRYPAESLAAAELESSYPIKILLVTANPEDPDLEKLDLKREVAIVEQALRPLEELGYAKVEKLEGANVPDMRRKLRDGDYHVLHFLGHGIIQNDQGALALESEDHTLQPVVASQIRTMLRSTSVKVIILNACETAAYKSGVDPITSVALSLIRAGVPAIMAMQFKVPDKTAKLFARELYSSLAQGKPLDQAVTEMRQAAYIDEGDMVYWGIPVLFMRSQDGVIWEPNAEVAAKLAAYQPKPQASDAIKEVLAKIKVQVDGITSEIDPGDASYITNRLQNVAEILEDETPDLDRLERVMNGIEGVLDVYGPAVADPIKPKIEEVIQLADEL